MQNPTIATVSDLSFAEEAGIQYHSLIVSPCSPPRPDQQLNEVVPFNLFLLVNKRPCGGGSLRHNN